MRSSNVPIRIDRKAAAAMKVGEDDDTEIEEETVVSPPTDEARATAAKVASKIPGAIAKPVLQMPVNEDALLNNILAKGILNGVPDKEPDDLSLLIMQEVVRKALAGESMSGVEERIRNLSSMMHDQHELLQAIILGPHYLHEKMQWIKTRTRSNRKLRESAEEAELDTAELLALARHSNDMIEQIDKEIKGAGGADPVTVVHRIENARKRDNPELAKKFENTTPQGREIVRKQVFKLRRRIQAHREKAVEQSGSTEQ